MRRIKSLWYLTAAATAALALLAPAAAVAVTLDPYAYRSISGSIYLEYEKTDAKDSATGETGSRKFLQAVSLDVTSWIVSRRLATYRTGAAFTHSDEQGTTKNDKVTGLSYYLTLNVLPLSPIPLTLYGSRLDTRAKNAGDRHDTEYGLQWFGYFATLPQTSVAINRREAVGPDIKQNVTDYNVGLLKIIGSSQNEFNYKGSVNDNRLTGTASSTHLFSFTNRTDMPGNSHLYAGLTKNFSTSTAGEHVDTDGVNLSYNSRPSSSFFQSHSYTSIKSKSEVSTQDSTYYSGVIDNYFSSRLRGHLSLSVNDAKAVDVARVTNNRTLVTDNYLSYAISRELSLTETVRYSDTKTENTSDVFALNVGNRRRLEVNTDARYNRRLSWTALTAGYGFGYTDDTAEVTVDQTGGKGISQTARLSLSDIDFNRYVGFNTSIEDKRTKKLTGNLSDDSRSFTLGAFNRIGKAYVSLDANYSASSAKSYLDAYNSTSEEYDAGIRSSYFKGTTLGMRFTQTKAFNEVNGDTVTSTRTAEADHTRNILGGSAFARLKIEATNGESSQTGPLERKVREMAAGYTRGVFGGLATLSWKRDVNDSTRSDNRVLSDVATYTLTYEKPFFRLAMWLFKAERMVSKINDTVTDSREIVNSVLLPVRAWTFSAEHGYRFIGYEPSGNDYRETRVIFRAARYFFNAF